MAFKHPLVHRSLGLLGYGFGVGLRSTLDARVAYADVRVDTKHPDHYERCIFAVWHETLLVPVLMGSGVNQVVLASGSGDGEIIARILNHLGWATARGSTNRGGVTAVLRFVRDDHRSPNIAVDGPRGPRRVMSMGAIYLASKLDLPIVGVGVGLHRPWRLRSWDRFAVPRPYSRARILAGPPRRVPAGLERDALEAYRLWFESELNWLTAEAETWADSGRRRTGEISLAPNEMSPTMPYWTPAHAVRLPESLENSWAALPHGASRNRAA